MMEEDIQVNLKNIVEQLEHKHANLENEEELEQFVLSKVQSLAIDQDVQYHNSLQNVSHMALQEFKEKFDVDHQEFLLGSNFSIFFLYLLGSY